MKGLYKIYKLLTYTGDFTEYHDWEIAVIKLYCDVKFYNVEPLKKVITRRIDNITSRLEATKNVDSIIMAALFGLAVTAITGLTEKFSNGISLAKPLIVVAALIVVLVLYNILLKFMNERLMKEYSFYKDLLAILQNNK